MDTQSQNPGKRKRILRHTVRLFKSGGVRKVTLDEIAAEAGVSKMTIYKYFGNREELLRHVCSDILGRRSDSLREVVESKDSVIERMKLCLAELTGYIAGGDLTVCLECARLNEGAGLALTEFEAGVKDLIIGLISEGKKQGLIKTEAADETLYRYIDMGLSYFQHNDEYRKKMLNDPVFRDDIMTFLWSHIFTDVAALKRENHG